VGNNTCIIYTLLTAISIHIKINWTLVVEVAHTITLSGHAEYFYEAVSFFTTQYIYIEKYLQ